MRAYSSSRMFRILACLFVLAGLLSSLKGTKVQAVSIGRIELEMLTETQYLDAAPYQWSKSFGSTGWDVARSVTTDDSGNVFIAGDFSGTVDFGGGEMTSAGDRDIILAKYDSNGTYMWCKSFGSIGPDDASSVTTDGSGNVFIAGYFSDTVDFGGGGLTSVGGNDIYLAKFDASGNHLWSKRFGGSSDHPFGQSVATDGAGNVFVAGHFSGTVDFGSGEMTSAGDKDIYLAKYNVSGNHLWSRRFGSSGSDLASSAVTDASGNVFITGYFNETVDFGGGGLTSAGYKDIFLAKYDASGKHLWSKSFGDGAADHGYSVATDASGNVFVTGYFTGLIKFGVDWMVSYGEKDIFLVKFDASGDHLWSKHFGGEYDEYAFSATTDSFGSVFVTGHFMGTVNFGGGYLTSAGYWDTSLAKYDANGKHQWSKRFGGQNGDIGYSIATDATDNVFLTGFFQGTADFGSGVLTSAGEDDIFLAKYVFYHERIWLPAVTKGE